MKTSTIINMSALNLYDEPFWKFGIFKVLILSVKNKIKKRKSYYLKNVERVYRKKIKKIGRRGIAIWIKIIKKS